MEKNDVEAQARLLIELGEPESWLETMQRAAGRSALHASAHGDETLAERWRKLCRALNHASAGLAQGAANPMQAGGPNDTSTQSQTQPTGDNAT
jgi:hypothetical protein